MLFCVERAIEGNYIKYNNNSGFVEHDEHGHARATPHAFSRFTFGASKGAVQIVDIQGVGDIYTDPQARASRAHTQRPPAAQPFRWPPPPSPSAPLQIHSLNGVDFGEGNLGVGGMALFFSTASYDGLCKLLKLPNFGACARQNPSHHSSALPRTDAMLGIAWLVTTTIHISLHQF